MRHRSLKKQAEYRLRVPLVKKLLEERPMCEACPIWAEYDGKTRYIQNRSADIHEVQSRGRGGSILEEMNLMAVCRSCHDRITRSPPEASTTGMSLPSWATPGMFEEAIELRLAFALGAGWTPSWETCTGDNDPSDTLRE